MKRLVPLMALSAAALLAAACSTATHTPTPTVTVPTEPTATPTILPTSTPLPTLSVTDTPIPTPTPSVAQEWSLLDIAIDGSTVTVELQVFAAIDVTVTLDGNPPDETSTPTPILGHVFKNVAPGLHTVEVEDVVGYTETRLVSVPVASIGGGLPSWLGDLIQGMEEQPPANPPISITRYEYKDQVVYYQTARCCDFFTNLYDADGVLIGHPDGGISGGGDGTVPDFFEERSNEFLVWKDVREQATQDTTQVPAPIDGVELVVAESFPLQYFLTVTSGLPNSCHTSSGYTLTRDGANVLVRVFNRKPTDESIACAEIYRTVEETIPLGSDYDTDTTYVVDVNGEVLSFKGAEVTAP